MKKIFLLFVFLFSFSYQNLTFSAEPEINCVGLPGCVDTNIQKPGTPDISNNIGARFMSNIIGEFIQIVAVFAVFALIFSGVLYLLSSGDEEKANKAKKWIIWSLVGVLLSISSWGIINFLNNIRINNSGSNSNLPSSSSTTTINFMVEGNLYDTKEVYGDYPELPSGYTDWEQTGTNEFNAIK
ncbi:MAG: pilin [Candidatus Gracilibacteria bacterium]|nr:pilin [Candidatus Gracilibacteria bacterium]